MAHIPGACLRSLAYNKGPGLPALITFEPCIYASNFVCLYHWVRAKTLDTTLRTVIKFKLRENSKQSKVETSRAKGSGEPWKKQ